MSQCSCIIRHWSDCVTLFNFGNIDCRSGDGRFVLVVLAPLRRRTKIKDLMSARYKPDIKFGFKADAQWRWLQAVWLVGHLMEIACLDLVT